MRPTLVINNSAAAAAGRGVVAAVVAVCQYCVLTRLWPQIISLKLAEAGGRTRTGRAKRQAPR